jgi:diadenosine tetraphosphate (Ap4A) HIT family hydrolase
MTTYKQDNIFAKIIRRELPCKIVYEDEKILAFHDIYPVAPIHVLVVPKGEYVDFSDFMKKADDVDIKDYFNKITIVAEKLGLTETGYSLVSNIGSNSGQVIFHFHTHIIAGKEIKGLIQ